MRVFQQVLEILVLMYIVGGRGQFLGRMRMVDPGAASMMVGWMPMAVQNN